jgi:hypothetical protein
VGAVGGLTGNVVVTMGGTDDVVVGGTVVVVTGGSVNGGCGPTQLPPAPRDGVTGWVHLKAW